MEDLVKLKFERGQVKAKVTRLETYVNSLDLSNLDESIIEQLQLIIEKIIPTYDEFQDFNSQIDFILSQNGDTSVSDEQNIFEEKYFQLVAKIKSVISSATRSVVYTSPNSIINENQSQQSIKLPTIKLPTFNGRYDSWLEFRDAFNALIHENYSLSEIQKFYYLRSSLEKDASQIIQSLEISAANYSIAWQLLQERYENKRLIIHNHVKAMFDLPAINKESHINLRNLFDNITKNLRSLKSLGQPTEQWDTLILHIISTKLDPTTVRDWESFELENELPTMNDMNKFLKQKCELLEKLEYNKTDNQSNKINKFSKPKHQLNLQVNTSQFCCFYCKKPHTIYKCDTFLKLSPTARISEIKKLNLCLNCLQPNHAAQECQKSHCRKCNRPHNTLLHIERSNNNNSNNNLNRVDATNTPEQLVNATVAEKHDSAASAPALAESLSLASRTINNLSSQVLLSTAIVQVKDSCGKFQKCRVLLDNGSQSNFITENLCKKLKLQLKKVDYSISGVGQARATVNYKTDVELFSCNNSFSTRVSCLVLPKLTDQLPTMTFNTSGLDIPKNLYLADPTFNQRSSIDILLGSDIFWQLICIGQVQLGINRPILQKTRLGWIVSGNLKINDQGNKCENKILSYFNTEVNNTDCLDEQLKKFWQVEEIISKPILSESEQYCESHFLENLERDHDGRFIVSIPFNNNLNELGPSRNLAMQRFYSQEKRLSGNPELYDEYKKFMLDYENLGHMSEINENNIDYHNELNYYLPHHAVVKESSITTKVRVVFNAAMKTENDVSLNDVQYPGPAIQNDIFSIILRFRKYEFVMTADISKMYRQVKIKPDQRCFQRIFWRSNSSSKLKCYELNTVTYGTASAPYLAIRCLRQVANENEINYPQASNAIKHDFYVDDCLTGSDSSEELLKLQGDLTTILSNSGFELRKWLSNNKELLEKFQVNYNLESSTLLIGEDEANKTLGIFWNSTQDTIQYSVKNFNCKNIIISKRTILSTISQVYDPLGLLGPVIVVAKLLIQKLWQAKIGWDEAIPQHLYLVWIQFLKKLPLLNDLKIPRHVVTVNYTSIELHGFCDSSERAFGSCFYIRCKDNLGNYVSKLLCAKSKVAPIKQLTLPRLELCAAHLQAKLFNKIIEAIGIQFDKIYLWSDSTITLSWLRASANKWKTFVANRVSEIQSLTNINDWHHVKSTDNPADLLSRGMNTTDILNSEFWWSGPAWLRDNKELENSEYNLTTENLPEQRTISIMVTINNGFNIFKRFSSLSKLQRTVAYCYRFVSNAKLNVTSRQQGPLTSNELQQALYKLIRLAQKESFTSDYDNLIKKRQLSKKSNLLSLNPFLDDNELIRVGGRIQNSQYNYDKKHPIILPPKHTITKLILMHEHLKLLHCGPTMLLSHIRERFWPISGRNLAKGTVRKCVRCFKVNPSSSQYLMGNLPATRINQYTPFFNTGIDYAGPFSVRDRNTRGAKLTKAYVCLFICLSTKAVHIELVSDLTTDCFLAALKRFIGRRGKPLNIYSDNGKNFVGASAKLAELYRFINSESDKITTFLSTDNITWHFIPARAPNFGGIWEAGIKSVKHHLKRVLGNAHLNFEDFSTVLIQIESILNSRPLCPLSSNPDQITALTPAHFLVGKTLTSIPEPSVIHINENRLKKYQRLQQLLEHFWSRWHKEYVSELQTRVKWKLNSPNLLKVGTIVLVKEENLPPLKWHIGRVLQLHPGADGVIRVVTIRVNGSNVKRAVTKLCVFPDQDDNIDINKND